MKIAVQQMRSEPGNVQANITRISAVAADAAGSGATLLVLPELVTTGYGAGSDLGLQAESRDGQQADSLQAIATRHNLAIVCGFAERNGGEVFNSALFVDDQGTRLVYRKCHLWGDYERSHFVAAAPEAVLLNYQGLRIGLLICYDVEFPERVRALALAGADLVAVPTATPAGPTSTFIARRMLPVRGFESQVYIAYANHHGSDGRFDYAGLSTIVAPDGQIICSAEPSGEELLIADIDPAVVKSSRASNPYLTDLVV